jgi:hypothetical protein
MLSSITLTSIYPTTRIGYALKRRNTNTSQIIKYTACLFKVGFGHAQIYYTDF